MKSGFFWKGDIMGNPPHDARFLRRGVHGKLSYEARKLVLTYRVDIFVATQSFYWNLQGQHCLLRSCRYVSIVVFSSGDFF